MRYAVAQQAAHTLPGSLERLLKVTGFVVSIYSCVYRPFAPCRSPAGETFELVAPDKGIRALGEKVRCDLLSACVPLQHCRMRIIGQRLVNVVGGSHGSSASTGGQMMTALRSACNRVAPAG